VRAARPPIKALSAAAAAASLIMPNDIILRICSATNMEIRRINLNVWKMVHTLLSMVRHFLIKLL
jgi:hypothetical protein